MRRSDILGRSLRAALKPDIELHPVIKTLVSAPIASLTSQSHGGPLFFKFTALSCGGG